MTDYKLFAEVILPLPLPRNYTYAVPAAFEKLAAPGMRVEIQFGAKRIYSGIIKSLTNKKPDALIKLKPILNVLDLHPVVFQNQLKLWEWISDYYLCNEGDVMQAALPAVFKLESKSSFILHPHFDGNFDWLGDKEYLVAEALTVQHELSVEQISRITGLVSVQKLISSMLEKKVLLMKEQLQEKLKPKFEWWVKLNDAYKDDDALKKLFDELEHKAPQQLQWLLSWFQMVNLSKEHSLAFRKADLKQKCKGNDAAFSALVKKNIFQVEERIASRIEMQNNATDTAEDLSIAQQAAFEAVKKQFEKTNTVLLHGVTGSGKTNIYIKLIEEQLAVGKQVLYLLPEIALTTQITSRLKKVFGNELGIYHSKFNHQERVEIWNQVLEKKLNVVIGARSALFLPMSDIGFIIVDEEHDTSYKQYDPSPRYHARDAAVYYASLFHAKTLLGTATPSIETFANCKAGKYGLVKLKERFGGLQLPQTIIADTLKEKKQKTMHGHFSSTLLDEMKKTLLANEQVILFQNRRGYAPYTECKTCGWTPECPNCDVKLIYHKKPNELKCHYCNYRHSNFASCPACGGNELHIEGFGTEKIEDELPLFIPGIKVGRMDVDTVRTKNSHNKLIHDFEEQKIQVLVGTQMVTKGLDFDHVSLVGILSADQLINQSDFRAAERAFQLMEQVKGRAGRKNKRGLVVVQTNNPNYAVLRYWMNNDFDGFYDEEIVQREKFSYPPFTRIIRLTLKHKNKDLVQRAAIWFADLLRKKLGTRLLGPAEPVIGKIKNMYLMDMIIKLEKNQALIKDVKQLIRKNQEDMKLNSAYKQVLLEVDVDPF